MSWMDSWSRPSKSQATPPPQYLIPGGENTPYCHSCGRIINSRKAQQPKDSKATPVKYCSTRCRNNKPGQIDREIEAGFVSLLTGSETLPSNENEEPKSSKSKNKAHKKKGETRILVLCSAVENLIFGDRHDPTAVYGRKKNRVKRGVPDAKEWKSVDMVSDPEDGPAGFQDSDGGDFTDGGMSIELDGDVVAKLSIRSGTRIRPAQEVSEVNGGVGGEKGVKERIEETQEMLEKRREGQKRADEREMVRCAARRGVAFGFLVSGDVDGETEKRRLCEAVMLGKVVESSFAKGDWGIRWRE